MLPPVVNRAARAVFAVALAAGLVAVQPSTAQAASLVTIVPGFTGWSSVMSPDGSTIAAVGGNTVALFDTATRTYGPSYPAGAATNLLDAVFSADGLQLYAVDGATPGVLYTMTVATGAVAAPLTLTGTSTPTGIDLDPATGLLYISNDGAGGIAVVNPSTSTVTTYPTADTALSDIAVGAGAAYASRSGGSTVSVLDTTTNTVGTPLPSGLSPVAVAVNPAHAGWIHTADAGNLPTTASGVSFIDTTGVTPLVSVPLAATALPFELAISPDGNTIAVVSWTTNDVTFVDFASRSVFDTITFATGIPFSITISPDGSTAYVAVANSGMAIIDITRPVTPPTTGGGGAASMPPTGWDGTPLLVAAASLIAVGAALVAVRRRPRHAASSH